MSAHPRKPSRKWDADPATTPACLPACLLEPFRVCAARISTAAYVSHYLSARTRARRAGASHHALVHRTRPSRTRSVHPTHLLRTQSVHPPIPPRRPILTNTSPPMTAPSLNNPPSRFRTPLWAAVRRLPWPHLSQTVDPPRLCTPRRSADARRWRHVAGNPRLPARTAIDRGRGERQAFKTLQGFARAPLARMHRCGACGLPACTLQGARSPQGACARARSSTCGFRSRLTSWGSLQEETQR